MERLKELIQEQSRWKDLEIYPTRIEAFLDNDFISAIENGKALIETICKTILDEQKESYEKNETINKLVSKTLFALGIFAKGQISKFGSGIVTALHNLGELRNKIGDTAHGKSLLEIRKNKIEALSAGFLINSVELLACFLIEYYEFEFPTHKEKKERKYEDFQTFNEYLDETYGNIQVADYKYLASEILFAVDETAYDFEFQKYLSEPNDTNRE
jgi:hypothetical protein